MLNVLPVGLSVFMKDVGLITTSAAPLRFPTTAPECERDVCPTCPCLDPLCPSLVLRPSRAWSRQLKRYAIIFLILSSLSLLLFLSFFFFLFFLIFSCLIFCFSLFQFSSIVATVFFLKSLYCKIIIPK